MNGIYVVYFNGATGVSMGMFLINEGVIAGADIGGLLYDGNYDRTRKDALVGEISFFLPTGASLITGEKTDFPQRMSVPLELPADPSKWTNIRIETPLGPVSANFQKIRSI